MCVERFGVDVGEVEPIVAALGESDRDQAQTTPSGAADAAIHATFEHHLDFDVEDVSLQPSGHLLEPLAFELDRTPAPLTVRGHDARVGIGGQASDEVSAVSVNRIKELVAKVTQVKEQQAPLDPRPHLQRAVVVCPLAGHLDLVRPGPSRAHHQVQLHRRRAGVLPGAGKAPRQQSVHLDHRRIGDQHVTESFQHAGVAHLARRELRHQLAQHRPKHPGQVGAESVVERRGHQRLAGHSFVGASKTGQRALAPGSESQQHRP